VSLHRKRILFLAEGITMAHFTRPAVLAESLDPSEWEVSFRTPRRYHTLLRPTISDVGDLWTLDPGVFLERLANGSVLYAADEIERYVQDELALFKEIQPDLVVGDYRLSLCISGPVGGVAFASIFNAYWSPYGKQRAVVPELPVTRWVSPRLLNPLSALVRPLFYALHSKPLNAVRRAHGLEPLSRDIRDFYTTGNLVLYPDIPELVPIAQAPHHHFIGICPWSAPSPKPGWWDEAMASSRPRVFVALGSSGPVKALPAILEALSDLRVIVILATSGRAGGKLPSNVYAADLLPFEETARRCSVLVSHGGSSGIYPALAAGLPVLALPGNIDTHLSAAVLERSGAGLSVRVERASRATVRAAVERLLSDARFKRAAVTWAGAIARYDTREIFPRVLRQWFAGGGPATRGPQSPRAVVSGT
jgi:UDP:flavonoid glycosyltransferase YjiC (YdhE family)